MHHYFLSQEHNESDYFTFHAEFEGKSFSFRSCSDVFSKNELDFGSLVLVKNIIERKELFVGKIMDMCCGYGTISILLDKFMPATYYLSDVNATAVGLAKINAKLNKTSIDEKKIYCGNMFEGIAETFNHVVSNPPIKAGKKYLIEFVDGSFSHLEKQGTLTLVIKKNLGADSLKKYLTNLFGNCEVWDRERGYYILHSKKTD